MAKTEMTDTEPVSESYISIGLGLLVVVVVGILLYNYFTGRNTKPTITDKSVQDKLAQEATMSAKPGSTYTVREGDTLWSISEKSYGTGYNWVDIQKSNNLTSGDELVPGQELQIPEASPILAMAKETQASPLTTPLTPSPVEVLASPLATPVALSLPTATFSPQTVAATATISGNTYTVVHGDTLWNIACRAYNDCYAWVKIAEANKLVNPGLIHAGNIFTLPR